VTDTHSRNESVINNLLCNVITVLVVTTFLLRQSELLKGVEDYKLFIQFHWHIIQISSTGIKDSLRNLNNVQQKLSVIS